ncbi:hypothetical protein COY23_04385 [bacterium (Candidatus Torokbacteria) CG_4_10_14_0_2_um_filter_35_8]|nr:MAG: hypothetical protein COY23_04385 [bacterium (Candidatus Torokbacteria) CG_4_10_14_0_2_um_filter_35_8]
MSLNEKYTCKGGKVINVGFKFPPEKALKDKVKKALEEGVIDPIKNDIFLLSVSPLQEGGIDICYQEGRETKNIKI